MNIPIVFAINNSYIKQVATVMTSILKNSNKRNCYEFSIMHTDITPENQTLLKDYIATIPNGTINFVDMNNFVKNADLESLMSRRKDYTYISPETYFRFYIPEIFKNYDKVIYLDADIIVMKDVALLYNEDITEYYCGAIQDSFMTSHIRNYKRTTAQYPDLTYIQYLRTVLEMKDNKYFNAGVLLLNLNKMREENISQKLWQFAQEKSPLEFQDQDVLNAIFERKVKYVDTRWNCLKGFLSNKTPYIMHFVGPEKPWVYESNYSYNYACIDEWWRYYELTPCFDKKDLELKQQIQKKQRTYIFKNYLFSIKNIGEYKIVTILGFQCQLERKIKPIKVALLIDEYFGGAGTAFGGYGFLARKYIAKYIPCENIEVDVLLERKKGLINAKYEIVDGVKVYRLPENAKLAKKWLNKQNYDLFLSIEMTYPSYQIMKLVDNKKLVLWVQDPRPSSVWEPKRETVSLIKDPCVTDKDIPKLIEHLNSKDLVRFISQGYSLNPLAKTLYNLPENTPIQYLPNPIELDMNYKFDLSKKKKQVIFLGRLEAQKRAWLFCEVAKRMPEYEFYVMGKFFRDEENNKKPLLPYLNNDIPNLHFTGHLEGEEKEKLIRESRILLNTSIWEGIPISWLEALQYGTSIVSCLDNENLPSRFGAFVGEILGDGYDKADLFIPAIRELMENDELYSQKAQSAIEYIRENHNIDKFIYDFRNVIFENIEREVKTVGVNEIPKPKCVMGTIHHIDVKISYACNFKCEYCYQVDKHGVRNKGMFSKENIDNLMGFIDRLNAKCRVNLVGGEPFIYPYLNEMARILVNKGHLIDMITNFSVPFERIETFLNISKNNLRAFSVSIHISQWENINVLYNKLEQLISYKKNYNYDWPIYLTCVITEENFDNAIEIGDYIKDKFGLSISYQRVYYDGVYAIYSERIEKYFETHNLDVPEEKANNINFFGKYCWAGSKFFYIEYNGDVHRCYTPQVKNDGILGNLSNYKQIEIPDMPTPCLSKRNGNCVCFKHFVGCGFVTDYKADDSIMRKYFAQSIKRFVKYNAYRFACNVTSGKLKQKFLAKKNKYKDKV